MCRPHSENHWSKCFHPAPGQGARLTFYQVSPWATARVCSFPGEFDLSFLGLLHRHTGQSWPVLKGHQDLKMTATGPETSSGPLLAFWRSTWASGKGNIHRGKTPDLKEPTFGQQTAAARRLTHPLPEGDPWLSPVSLCVLSTLPQPLSSLSDDLYRRRWEPGLRLAFQQLPCHHSNKIQAPDHRLSLPGAWTASPFSPPCWYTLTCWPLDGKLIPILELSGCSVCKAGGPRGTEGGLVSHPLSRMSFLFTVPKAALPPTWSFGLEHLLPSDATSRREAPWRETQTLSTFPSCVTRYIPAHHSCSIRMQGMNLWSPPGRLWKARTGIPDLRSQSQNLAPGPLPNSWFRWEELRL